MAISRYPRPGHRIAPLALREILCVPVLDRRFTRSLKLCDLDETAWERFDPVTCRRLAAAVVRQIPSCLPEVIKQRHLPKLPEWVTAKDLLVEPRTRNCLEEQGLLDHPQELENFTIGQVCKFGAFGKKSLVDLLTSLESFVIWRSGPQAGGELNLQVTQAARELLNLTCSSSILRDDPRFGRLISEIGLEGTSLQRVADIILSRKVDPVNPEPLIRRLVELHRHVSAAARMSLDTELLSLIDGLGNERNRQIIVAYVGLDGSLPRTLEAVGQQFHMTRERVRQICDRVSRVQTSKPYLPALDRVLKIVAAAAPSTAEEIESTLLQRRLTRAKFRVEAICSVARLFGRELRFTIDRLHGHRFVVLCNSGDLLKRIDHVARGAVSHWGATTVDDIAAATSATRPLAREVLVDLPGFKWLDEPSGWFWIVNVPRNALVTQIRKVLAASPNIDVGELRTGVSRHHRRKGFAPPRRVLLELCRQLSWCRVADERITPAQVLNPNEILSDSEQTIFRVMKEHGPVMQRPKFEELCLNAGLNRHSFWIFLSYCPIISRYAPGVYGLRGAEVPAGLVESLMLKRTGKSQLLVDYGWTKDRNIQIVYRVSSGMLSNGIVSIPAALKKFLQGRFTLMAIDNSRIGALVVKDNSAWGLGPFFSRRGGEPGDYISLLLNLSAREAVVQIGDASLVDGLGFSAIENDKI